MLSAYATCRRDRVRIGTIFSCAMVKYRAMILYLIGVVLTVFCVIDISRKNITTAGKVVTSVIVILTSWIGIAVYFLYARNRLEVWFKK